MADVFISYKRKQRDQAQQVAELLRANAYDVWWDRELVAGDNFQRTIDDELDAAGCAIVLWSQLVIADSDSGYVVSEAMKARNLKKLVGANLDGVELPTPFTTLQCANLVGWNGDADAEGAQDILRAVARLTHRSYVAPESQRKKWAVLVANGRYSNDADFPSLADTPTATEALARRLGAAPGTPFHCITLFDKGRKEVRDALKERAAEAAGNEPIILYFRGHAHLSRKHGVCLCLADTDADDLVATALPLRSLVEDILGDANSEQVVILLDCAFSAANDVPASSVKTLDVADALKQDLAVSKRKSIVLATATVACDGGSSGAFTKALAASLQDWSADRDHDNIITLDEWFDGAATAVDALGEKAQKWSPALGGNVEIARRAPRSQAAPDSREEIPPALLDAIEAALSDQRAIIPLLGNGVFETGPLSCHQLVEGLKKLSAVLAAAPPDLSLPEAAEYLIKIRYRLDRQRFLLEFRKILEEQQRGCGDLPIHDLILDCLEVPWLVVSTTYDWTLEHRLEQARRSFLVVAHLLRSEAEVLILHCHPKADRIAELKERGVALVSGPDSAWIIYRSRADEFLPDEAEDCIIYKVLGSPFLNQRAEGLQAQPVADTVVITETDHAILLGRLERKSANVPTAFADPFRLRHLLFLGYSLDLWHYRLFGNLFRRAVAAIETQEGNLNNPIAVVRPQTTQVEIEFWRALGAEHHLCSVKGLARALMARKQEGKNGP